jgi:hypothetical protein
VSDKQRYMFDTNMLNPRSVVASIPNSNNS